MASTSTALIRHVRHCSLGFEACRTVQVTARLRSGAVIPERDWFPAPLDGILAHAARRRRLGASWGTVVDHHSEELPLTSTARTVPRGQPRFGDARWSWAATCAWWDSGDQDVRWVHKRAWSEQQAARVGIGVNGTPANPDVGRFKAHRIPVVATVAPELTWWCLGDPDRIRDLLADVDAVGKKHNVGEGQVAAWDVRDIGPPDWQAVCWLPDGRVARPFAARHRAALGVGGADTVTVDAYRPPYWRPAMHGKHRELVEVIAPWTTRPEAS